MDWEGVFMSVLNSFSHGCFSHLPCLCIPCIHSTSICAKYFFAGDSFLLLECVCVCIHIYINAFWLNRWVKHFKWVKEFKKSINVLILPIHCSIIMDIRYFALMDKEASIWCIYLKTILFYIPNNIHSRFQLFYRKEKSCLTMVCIAKDYHISSILV